MVYILLEEVGLGFQSSNGNKGILKTFIHKDIFQDTNA